MENVKVAWNDVFIEPEGLKNLELMWSMFRLIYKFTLIVFYFTLSFILGPIFALIWGIIFGFLSFFLVWLVNPTVRAFSVTVDPIRRFIATVCQTAIEPCCISFGSYWERIKVRYQPLPFDGDVEKAQIMHV